MNISKTTLPEGSILHGGSHTFDYIDSFQAKFSDPENRIVPKDVGKAFFKSAPKWVEKLFNFRNKIALLFGLKTSGKPTDREHQLNNFKCEPGEQLGLFKVFHKNEDEVILGENDKHLNFRISLFLEKSDARGMRTLIISTTVEFQNWFGRLYFLPVRPFHKIIVPVMLKGIIRSIDKK